MKQSLLLQVKLKSVKTGHYLGAFEGLSRDKRLGCREGGEPLVFLLDGDLTDISLKVLGKDLWLGFDRAGGMVKLLDSPVGARFTIVRRENGACTLKSTLDNAYLWLREAMPLVSRAGKPGQKEAQWVIEGLGSASVPTVSKTGSGAKLTAPSGITLGKEIVAFGQGYAPPRAQLLEEGVVLLSGALKLNGTEALLGVLAPEFRPRVRLMHVAGREPGATATRVDILPDGRVFLVMGPNTAGALVSLTGIVFPRQGGTPASYIGGAASYGYDYGGVDITTLSGSFALLSGAAKVGTNLFVQLPDGKRPAEKGIYSSWTGSRADRLDVVPAGTIRSTFLNNGWVALSRVLFPIGPGEDVEIGATPYGYGFTQPRARRLGASAVVLRGVAKFTDPAQVATLPTVFRPRQQHLFPVWYAPFSGGSQLLASVVVLPSGVVQLKGVTTGEGWVSLDGILFPLG